MSVHAGGRGWGHSARKGQSGGGTPTPTPAPSPTFAHSRTITVNNTGNTAKTDYPVQIALTSGNFNFTHTQSDGRDVRFKDAGGSVIPHWRQDWDSVGQTGTLWVKVPTVPNNASITLTMEYGSAGTTDYSSIQNTFTFGEDFGDDTRLKGYPDKTYPGRTGDFGIVLGNVRKLATVGSAGAWNETLREQANIVYDPYDADPNKRYKFIFTGQTLPATTGDRHIGLSYSPDLQTWTEYSGNPVIGNTGDANRGEDPYVVRNIDGSAYRDPSGKYHMFSEDQAQLDLLHYTTTDFITWTADPANPVVQRGAVGSYDDNIVASPIVIHMGGDNSFFMVYEARSSVTDASDLIGNNFEWAATARATSLTGKVWTKLRKIHYGDVPDDLVYDAAGGKWWYTWHNTSKNLGRSYTTNLDPFSWTLGDFQQPSPDTGLFPSGNAGTSHNFAPIGPNGTGFGKALSFGDPQDGNFYIADILGSSQWVFARLGPAKNPRNAAINANSNGSGTLLLDPTNDNTTSVAQYCAYTSGLGLLADFQIMTRRKVEATLGTSGQQIGFGAGDPTLSGANFMYNATGGFYFSTGTPGSSNGQIRKYVGATATTPASAIISAANATNLNIHQISYLSSGVLRWSINGTQQMTTTDSAYTATAKELLVNQQTNNTNAGKSTYDWLVVRKYDGQDPATTVGVEV